MPNLVEDTITAITAAAAMTATVIVAATIGVFDVVWPPRSTEGVVWTLTSAATCFAFIFGFLWPFALGRNALKLWLGAHGLSPRFVTFGYYIVSIIGLMVYVALVGWIASLL